MQGAGKGTLGLALAERYQLEIFETGGELRKLGETDSDLARKVKAIIDAGHLVPNEVVMEIVENFMNNLPPGKNVLFDGIPRKTEQAQSLNEVLKKHGRSYKAVMLDIKKETALKRLTTRRIDPITKKVYPADYPSEISEEGNKLVTRQDDNPEAIENRLNAYEQETLPAIEMYNDLLIKINAEQSIDGVRQEAFEKLDSYFA